MLSFVDETSEGPLGWSVSLANQINKQAVAGQRVLSQGTYFAALRCLKRALALCRLAQYRQWNFTATHSDEITEFAGLLEEEISKTISRM